MATATFSGTYTQNNGEDYATGTVAITPYGGATVTATLDATGSYSETITLVLTSVSGVWENDAGAIVTSAPASGFVVIPPNGTVAKGKCRVVETITGKPIATSVHEVADGATVNTGRDVGTVLGGGDTGAGHNHSGTYADLRAAITGAVDRTATLSASIPYARVEMNINALGKHAGSGRIYGSSPINGHWTTSDDNGGTWTDRTFSPVSAAPTGIGSSCVMMVITDTYMFAVGTAGLVFRAAKDVWNAWTDVTPSGVPANTIGRPDVLHHNGAALLYTNYGTAGSYGTQPGPGAYVWVSTDNGATWSANLSLSNARHGHAISSDSAGVIYVTIGDSGGTPPWTQHGMYRSTNNGATFTRLDPLNPTYYGIGMVHPPAVSGVPDRVITEGDGPNPPHLMAWNKTLDTPGSSSLTPCLWPDTSSAAGSWRGTGRGIALTAEGNILFVSTSEGGATGTREGVWLAKGPWFDRCVLLEEVSGALGVTWIVNRGISAGPYVLNGRMRLTVPKFQGQ